MAQSNGFNLGQLLGPRSVIQADQLAADAGAAGVTTYTSINDLPSSGLTSGDMAFIDSSDRLYIWTGAGWYNIAVVNQTPAIQSILDSDGLSSPFILSNVGATTTITMIAADPDGFPVSYIAVADSDFNAMATLSQVSNVFTITPTAIENSTGTITFKASDGINLASEISTFTLSFSIPDPDFNSVSFLSHFNGADNGVNNTFIDGSTSAHAITANGNVTQGSFGPFARPDGEWGVLFDGVDDHLVIPNSADFNFGTGDFTVETWVNFSLITEAKTLIANYITSSEGWGIQVRASNNLFHFFYGDSTQISCAFTPVANQWYHLAVSRQGANLKLFVDGTLCSTVTNSLNITSTGPLHIGTLRTAQPQLVNGTISNARIVKGTAVYTSTFTPPTEPLTAITNTVLLTCQSNRFVDNSVSARTLTIVGNPAVTLSSPFATTEVYDPAVNGASGYFDGTGDYINYGNIGLDGHSGDFSIEAWIYPTFYCVSSNAIYTQGSASSVNNLLELSLNSLGKPQAFINGGTAVLLSTYVCPLNSWTFVQLKRTSGTLAIFINGAQSITVSNTATISSPNNGFVGTQSYDPGSASRSFFGFISDVRCSVVTRSVLLPTAPLAVIDSNTKLLLNMNNGKAIDGTAKNNLTLFGNAKLSTTQSKFGGASMYFDGTGDYATLYDPKAGHFGSGNFTAECWVYPTASPSQPIIFGQWSGSYSWALQMQNSNSRYLRFLTNAGGIVDNQSSTAVPLNQWSHVALVRNGNAVNAYLNGTSVVSSTVTGAFVNSTDALSIGGGVGGGQPYEGYIDKVRITKGLARYTANFTPPSEPFPDLG